MKQERHLGLSCSWSSPISDLSEVIGNKKFTQSIKHLPDGETAGEREVCVFPGWSWGWIVSYTECRCAHAAVREEEEAEEEGTTARGGKG